MLELSEFEQENLKLIGRHICLSAAGILPNTYTISPNEELKETLEQISKSLEKVSRLWGEPEQKITIIRKNFANIVANGSKTSAQSLVVECASEILDAQANVVILLVTGFEAFYTRNISIGIGPVIPIENIDWKAVKGDIRPKVTEQHFWDQNMVENLSFSPDYKKLFGELAKNGKKVFCLFHIGENLHPGIETIARNSIHYSHFAYGSRPLICHELTRKGSDPQNKAANPAAEPR